MSDKLAIEDFNGWPKEKLWPKLKNCCACAAWVQAIIDNRPYISREGLLKHSLSIWSGLGEDDYLEAFEGHPMIGDLNTRQEKYKHSLHFARGEQSDVAGSSDDLLNELSKFNRLYLEKFGFIFIVCATGKSAREMLDLLKQRLFNQRNDEIVTAAREQSKITNLRLEKLIWER